MNNDTPWKTHSSEYTYENPWFKVHTYQVTTPGGKPGIYGVIEIAPAVTVVALNDKQEFCLIREYRFAHQQWLWSLPVGGVGKEDDDLLVAAKRELLEETGYTSEDWQQLPTMHGLKGLTNQTITTFIAKNIVPGESHIEHDEGINGQRFISFKDFFAEVRDGTITDEETIAPVTIAAASIGLL